MRKVPCTRKKQAFGGEIPQGKKEHKPKLLGPVIFRRGGGLSREGVGAKKFGMSLEMMETKFLSGISRWCPKSLRKMFVFDSWSLIPLSENAENAETVDSKIQKCGKCRCDWLYWDWLWVTPIFAS